MTQAVLFDLDGTLINSEPIAIEAFCHAFKDCGGVGQPPIPAFLAMAGLPFEEIAAQLGLPTGMPASFREHSRQRAHKVSIFPGMLRILNRMTAIKIPIGIITGKDRPRTEELLARLELARFCRAIVTPSDPPRPKPHRDCVLWLCEKLSATVEESILVGDSVNDIVAGNAAGVQTIACLWGAGRRDDLLNARPGRVVASPDQLFSALLSMLAKHGPQNILPSIIPGKE